MKNLNRRHFVKGLFLGIAALPVLRVLGVSETLAAPKKPAAKAADVPLPSGEKAVSESDPVASAIGYKADAKNIDFAKYPKRKEKKAQGDFCQGCALYTSSNASWGKCQMLTSGLVASKGWCGSYSKKA